MTKARVGSRARVKRVRSEAEMRSNTGEKRRRGVETRLNKTMIQETCSISNGL